MKHRQGFRVDGVSKSEWLLLDDLSELLILLPLILQRYR